MTSQNVKTFLDEHAVSYEVIPHPLAFAASDVAAATHVAPRNFAKTVVVKIDGRPAMLVLPATRRISIHDLREMLETENVKLATETELRRWFPDCEVGAMPPFGNLYGMPVYVTASLAHEHQIAFNGGSHTETIKLAYEDFDRLVTPRTIDLVTT